MLVPNSRILNIAGWLGATGVILGAFGAHALKSRISPESLVIFHTGVSYHQLHAVAMLGLGILNPQSKWGSRIWGFWLAGVCVFSLSLYALAVTGIKVFGAITPIGGVLLISGWIVLALDSSWRTRPASPDSTEHPTLRG